MKLTNRVLVVGGTGFLGGKVVDQLLERGKTVRALVRPGSDTTRLQAKSVEIVRGDMLDINTLPPAMRGVDALITTAIGYSRRRKSDSETTDDIGNRNLIDAALQVGLPLFVFTGVLNAEKARNVSHFYQKVVIEDYLEQSGMPFVSIRPPGFIDQVLSKEDIARGRIMAPFAADAKASIILADDVARYLAMSVDVPEAVGQKIPVAAETPISLGEIAETLSRLSGRSIRLQSPPQWMLKVALPMMGLFNPMMREMPAMMDFIASGDYIAGTNLQRQYFDVRSTEDTLRQWLSQNNLLLRLQVSTA
ncbi:MAG: SDR family oxidoreductase [Anaerolineae bacterium]